MINLYFFKVYEKLYHEERAKNDELNRENQKLKDDLVSDVV